MFVFLWYCPPKMGEFLFSKIFFDKGWSFFSFYGREGVHIGGLARIGCEVGIQVSFSRFNRIIQF